MAGFWGLRRHWRPTGDSYLQNSYVVYVYFISYTWFPAHHLHGHCFLDEYEAVHTGGTPEPDQVPISHKSKVKSQKVRPAGVFGKYRKERRHAEGVPRRKRKGVN